MSIRHDAEQGVLRLTRDQDTASKTPRMKLNRVKMFARKISATDRLVRSPAAFASPRERRSAT